MFACGGSNSKLDGNVWVKVSCFFFSFHLLECAEKRVSRVRDLQALKNHRTSRMIVLLTNSGTNSGTQTQTSL